MAWTAGAPPTLLHRLVAASLSLTRIILPARVLSVAVRARPALCAR